MVCFAAIEVGLSNPLPIHHRCLTFHIILSAECSASREEQEDALSSGPD